MFPIAPADEEAQLVDRCLKGEQTAWDSLVKTYTRRVYGMCLRFTGNDSEAQDLTQEVFLRVFRTLGTFHSGRSSFTVWLARVTRNLLIDHYRMGRAERRTDALDTYLPVLEERHSYPQRTEGLLSRREAGEILSAALRQLSPELREAVILRDLEEMEYSEISQILGVPEGTVKSRLNRGRAQLARIVKSSTRPEAAPLRLRAGPVSAGACHCPEQRPRHSAWLRPCARAAHGAVR